jgi:hypothetical protein
MVPSGPGRDQHAHSYGLRSQGWPHDGMLKLLQRMVQMDQESKGKRRA